MTDSFERPRRFVSGVQPDGISTFVQEDRLEPRPTSSGSGLEVYLAWEGAQPLTLPPAEGTGLRVNIVRFLAGQSVGKPFSNYHWHDTLDVAIVISGTLAQRLDDGSEAILRPGDVLISCGTAHGWEARGDEDAVVALVMHDAERVGTQPPPERHITRVIPRTPES